MAHLLRSPSRSIANPLFYGVASAPAGGDFEVTVYEFEFESEYRCSLPTRCHLLLATQSATHM